MTHAFATAKLLLLLDGLFVLLSRQLFFVIRHYHGHGFSIRLLGDSAFGNKSDKSVGEPNYFLCSLRPSITSIFLSTNKVFEGIFRVKKRVTQLVWIKILRAILIIGLSSFFANNGLIYIGYSWLIGCFIVSITYIVTNYFTK